eukprot:gene1540-1703_t
MPTPITSTPVSSNKISRQKKRKVPAKITFLEDKSVQTNKKHNFCSPSDANRDDPISGRISVRVRIQCPSNVKEKELHPTLHPLGKMLCRGTYKQIAAAAWKQANIRHNLLMLLAKEIDKDCSGLC